MKSKLKSTQIKDVCIITTSSNLRSGDGLASGPYPFYTSGRKIKYLQSYQYNTRGIIIGRGGSPNIHLVEGMFNMSSDCCLLRLKSDDVDLEYIYYYLLANPSILQRLYKGAGMKHISITDIGDIYIEYPELVIQKSIISILSLSDKLLDAQKQVICRFSDVLYSYYIMMMTSVSSKYWKESTIDDIAIDIKSGPFGSQLKRSQFKETGDIYVLGYDNVKKNTFEIKEKRYLEERELEKYTRYVVKGNDVLLSITGTLGKSAVVPTDIGKAINTKHLACITLKESICNPYFISYSLSHSPSIKSQINKLKRGAIMDAILLSDVRKLNIKIPELNVQNYFCKVLQSHNSILDKIISIESLTKELKTSFLHEYLFNVGIHEDSTYQTPQAGIIGKAKLDLEDLLQVIKNGNVENLSYYNEIRKVLYDNLRNGNIVQTYDTVNNSIKLSEK